MHFFPQRVKNLLDNTEIFLMPTLNPDGFEESTFGFITTGIPSFIAGLGSSSRRRTNANLVDLNRNFPGWTEIKQSLKGSGDLKENREKETM